MRTDHYKVSPTAIMCAEIRAKYTDMPYAKEIYQAVAQDEDGQIKTLIPEWLMQLILRFPSIRTRASSLEGRYCSTNDAITRLGPQAPILELACGLSTRGLHLGKDHSVYLETDLEDMLAKKKAMTGNNSKYTCKSHFSTTKRAKLRPITNCRKYNKTTR